MAQPSYEKGSFLLRTVPPSVSTSPSFVLRRDVYMAPVTMGEGAFEFSTCLATLLIRRQYLPENVIFKRASGLSC